MRKLLLKFKFVLNVLFSKFNRNIVKNNKFGIENIVKVENEMYDPRDYEELNKKKTNYYSVQEMIIACYLAIYGNKNLKMSNSDIADAMGRSVKSLANKSYRFKKAIEGDNKIPSKNEINTAIKLMISLEEIEHRFATLKNLATMSNDKDFMEKVDKMLIDIREGF